MAPLKQLPPMMAFPIADIRKRISSLDWATCLEAWALLSRAYLQLPQDAFDSNISDDSSTLTMFLISYMSEMGTGQQDENMVFASRNSTLNRHVFLLAHRALTATKRPAPVLLQWTFCGDLSRIYRHTSSLEKLVETAWTTFKSELVASLAQYRATLLKHLDSNMVAFPSHDQLSLRLLPLLRACPLAGQSIIAGSDLLDSVSASYSKTDPTTRSRLLLLVYLGLNALMIGSTPNHGLLLDHLYSIRSSTEATDATREGTLLSDLMTDTPLLARLKKHFAGPVDNARATHLMNTLETHRRAHSSRHRPSARRLVHKGKGKISDEFGHGVIGNIHVHQMSMITQIQDLFPDLGSGFIHKLLNEYNDDIEQVTAHLLEDDLPPHLQALDRAESLPEPQHLPSHDLVPNLAPSTTPPPSSPSFDSYSRRNVYDKDEELTSLALGTSRLHLGRRDQGATADHLLSSRSDANAKAAILSALSAFDADDDEHDDTYDIEDVGGTVDSVGATVDTARPGRATEEGDVTIDDMRDKNEEALFSAWRTGPEVFERGSTIRLSQARRALKSETGMTDEAIEGWAIMIKRDPRRLRRLELKFETFGGRSAQPEIERTSWRGGVESTEGSESEGGGRGGLRGRGRGGGYRGRGRGGGNVAGQAGEQGTEAARHKKEVNKGSRANHNRRDQRAKKVARAGFPG